MDWVEIRLAGELEMHIDDRKVVLNAVEGVLNPPFVPYASLILGMLTCKIGGFASRRTEKSDLLGPEPTQ